MRWQRMTATHGGAVLLAVGLMLAGTIAGAQTQPGPGPASAPQQQAGTQLTDAQIESSVLQALAAAPDLTTQNIQTSTVYGVVTLSGNVRSEAQRTEAENLTAKTAGVKKVIDELQLGDTPPPQQEQAGGPDQAPPPGSQQPAYGQQQPGPQQLGYGQQQQGYSQQPGSSQQGYSQPYPQRQPMFAGQPNPSYVPPAGASSGQRAGIPATVPPGSTLQIRINRGLDSKHTQPGTPFDGTVLNDIVANGVVAIPRGAQVSGVVVDSKSAGALKGRGELALQLNSLTLGGQVYPVNTDIWSREGADKTNRTVGSAVGLGALGALFGAVAGGGAGAAIGAGVGGAAGVASSAASGGGQIVIPPESVLTFRIEQPLPVRTVSEQEMGRLAYGAGSGQPAQPPMRRYCRPYYGCYWGPAYPPPPPVQPY